MDICAWINRIANNWELQNWGIAGIVVGGIASVITFPVSIAGAFGGLIVTSGSGIIGTGVGVTQKISQGGEKVREISELISDVTADLLIASRETVQQFNAMVQYGGWTMLSGGVSVLLKWHENQYCADEELNDLVCTPIRLTTGAMIVATVGCTFFLFGKISAYYQKKNKEDEVAKKKQELEENLRQAQANVKDWKAEGPCAIM